MKRASCQYNSNHYSYLPIILPCWIICSLAIFIKRLFVGKPVKSISLSRAYIVKWYKCSLPLGGLRPAYRYSPYPIPCLAFPKPETILPSLMKQSHAKYCDNIGTNKSFLFFLLYIETVSQIKLVSLPALPQPDFLVSKRNWSTDIL